MPRKGYRFYDEGEDDSYDYYEDDYDEAPDASVSGLSQELQQPGWDCFICTFINADDQRACEMCGVFRSSEAPQGSGASQGKKSEPSEMAKHLFSPLPKADQKKGVTPVQVRESFLSEKGSSSAVAFKFDEPSPDDSILGAQHERRAAPRTSSAKASAGDDGALNALKPSPLKGAGSEVKRSKPVASKSKLATESELVEQLDKSITLTGDERGNNVVQQPKFQGLPLNTYKPEPWMLQGAKGADKNLLHLVVVGHVDAGKSTLMGRILHYVGRISQKEIHKNQKEATEMGKGSFAYAWALDEGAEERARGVTITVAVAHFETPRFHVVLLDAPGHKDFIPNMISGASQADAAVLVVDASAGEFEAGMGAEGRESGQTREHALLVRSLGVSQLVVAVNKMDAAEYSQERFEEIRGVLSPFLKQCGFRESAVTWIPVSAFSGQNLISGPTEKNFWKWYKGETLLDALDKLDPPERDLGKPFRLGIAEVVRTRTLGSTGVGGKIYTGAVKYGTKVMVMPSREIGFVKNIEQDGKARPSARAGDSIDLGLQGVDAGVLVPGGVLCHPDYMVPVATRFEAKILTLKIAMPIIAGSQVVLHVHHVKEPARVHLTSLLDSKSGEAIKRSPRCLTSNQSALVEVVPERGVCVEEYSNFRALGRVILRNEGRTLAVGIITRIISTQ